MQVRSDVYPLSSGCKLYPTCISCPVCVSCLADDKLDPACISCPSDAS